MRRLIVVLLLVVMPNWPATSGEVSSNIKSAWGYASFDVGNGAPGDFIIFGGTSTDGAARGPINCSYARANQVAAYGALGVVARQIVEHGGYFCPTQVQCDSNARKSASNVFFSWYNPAMGEKDDFQKYENNVEISTETSCRWLCDDGYYGIECKETSNNTCDGTSNFKVTIENGKRATSPAFGDFRMRRNHNRGADEGIAQVNCKSISRINAEIPLFGSGDDPAKGVVLGVIKFLDHGVVAAPIKLECAKRKDRKTRLSGISLADGKSRVLCTRGYRPLNGDCVAIDEEICRHSDMTYCDNFPVARYNADEHVLDYSGQCIKYFCKGGKKAFKSASDTSCTVDCGQNVRSAIDTNTGLCKVCEVGEYFNSQTRTCLPAKPYTRQELEYGQNADKKSPLDKQCWTLVGDEYKKCVTGN